MVILFIASLIIAFTAILLNIYLERKLKAYRIKILQFYEESNLLINFALNHILEIAIQNEDYETAKKCVELLKNNKIPVKG